MENRPRSPTEVTHLPHHSRSRRSGNECNGQEEDEEEADELEEGLDQMVQKLLNYRSSLPEQLSSYLASVLAARRPQFPLSDQDSDPGSSGESCSLIASAGGEEIANRISFVKEKISGNLLAMPLLLKRMNESISRIDKPSSRSNIIHPAFKRAGKKKPKYSFS